MLTKIKKVLGIDSYSESDENFVRLMQLASEDEGIRTRLLSILQLYGQARQTALDSILESVKESGAPEEFVEAMSVLQDDVVATRALLVLRGF